MRSRIKQFLYFPEGRIQPAPLIGLTLILVALHLIKLLFALDGQLHPDEAYYWAWSQKPALSYYDQGPGIAYYIWIWTAIFGDHFITLKTAALAASGATILLFSLAGLQWGLRGWKPLLSALALFFIPGILGGNHLIMHDSMMILSWAGALWMSIRAVQYRDSLSLIGLFFFLGLGGLSKYTMFLFAIALLLWLIFHPKYREFWIKPASWMGLALAAGMISPIILWNYDNHWDGAGAIIHLRSSGGVSGGGSTGAYLAGQFIMFSPFWMLALLFLSGVLSFRSLRSLAGRFKNRSRIKARQEQSNSRGNSKPDAGSIAVEPPWRNDATHLLWIVTAVPFLFFAFLSGDREIQANWVFPAYGSAILLLIYYLYGESSIATRGEVTKSAKEAMPAKEVEDLEELEVVEPAKLETVEDSGKDERSPARGKTRAILRGIFAIGWIPVVLLDFFFLFSIPVAVYLPIETYWVPGYRTLGFREVIQGVERIQKENHPQAKLAANRYQDASIGWFYNRDQSYVPSINIMQRNQFSYWPGLEPGNDYLFYHIQENTCEKSVSFLGVILPTFFEEVVEYPEEEIVHNRRVIKRYQVWFARGYKYPWDQEVYQFMRNRAIYQNMVGLRVPEPGKVVNVSEAFEQFSRLWMQIYMSRKGKQDCSVF